MKEEKIDINKEDEVNEININVNHQIQSGGNTKFIIAGVAGGVGLIAVLVYLVYKKYFIDKPEEAQEAMFDAVAIGTKVKGLEKNPELLNVKYFQTSDVIFEDLNKIFFSTKKPKFKLDEKKRIKLERK